MNIVQMPPRGVWHVAFTVSRLEEAMDDLHKAIGAGWGAIHEFEAEMIDGQGGRHNFPARVVFSTCEPCAIELFEAVPGTPLAQRGRNPFHHVGYWTDDIVGERAELDRLGWACAGATADRISVHVGRARIAIEACNVRVQRPGLEVYYTDSQAPSRIVLLGCVHATHEGEVRAPHRAVTRYIASPYALRVHTAGLKRRGQLYAAYRAPRHLRSGAFFKRQISSSKRLNDTPGRQICDGQVESLVLRRQDN